MSYEDVMGCDAGVGSAVCISLATAIPSRVFLRVCSAFFGVLVGLVPAWMVVGGGMFALCTV